MKMALDKAGRTVIPKELRRQLRLEPGMELEATVEDGRLVIAPAGAEVMVIEENGRLVATDSSGLPPMSSADLRRLIEDSRTWREPS